MSLLDKLKSLLGRESSGGSRRQRDVGVTVEHEPGQTEPDAETEAAVKGADVGTEPEAEEPPAPASPGGAEATEPEEPEPEEPATEPEPEAADEPEAEAEADEGAEPEAAEESPEALKGIGTAYAERLADAGVETVGDLADAEPEALAEETGVSESRLQRWIERARNR